VLVQQVSEGQDRGLIREPVADQVNACKTPHGEHLDEGLFPGRITEGVPLLQQMISPHRGQQVSRLPTLLAGLRMVWEDQTDECIREYNLVHLRQVSSFTGSASCRCSARSETSLLPINPVQSGPDITSPFSPGLPWFSRLSLVDRLGFCLLYHACLATNLISSLTALIASSIASKSLLICVMSPAAFSSFFLAVVI
jgi:hypothetical protein